MEYRTLGRTGLQVSALALGGSPLGSAFREVAETEAIETVHAALNHGINVIDTAPFYGMTESERVLGLALKGISRDRYYLSTKVARFGRTMEEFDFSAKRTARSVDESLQRLRLDYVDFIEVHDMEFGDMAQVIEETIPALRRAVEQGKARFIGVTGLPLKLFRQVIEATEIDMIQSYCHYCLNDTALLDLLPLARERGIGVFNSAPLAMQLLTDAGPREWHPAPAAVREQCAKAAKLCRDRGSNLGKLALQFSVANPDIHTNVVGTGSAQRILQNIRDLEEPLDRELLADVLQILEPIHNVTWPSGRPENN